MVLRLIFDQAKFLWIVMSKAAFLEEKIYSLEYVNGVNNTTRDN